MKIFRSTFLQKILVLVAFYVSFIAISKVGASPISDAANELTLTREVFLEKGNAVTPNAIIRTSDNGFVIAGTLGNQAWATGTDAQGKVKWRYLVPAPDKTPFGAGPQYHAAVAMPDGSVFLCGSASNTGDVHSPGLLTHLDKNGKILNEQQLYPHINGEQLGGTFLGCVTLDDGFAIVGYTAIVRQVEPTASHPLPVDEKYFYWILALDQAGKIKWEQFVPMSEMAGFNEVSLLPGPDGGFIFASARNGVKTEILHIASNGNVKAKNVIPDAFMLVQSSDRKATPQIISPNAKSLTLIKLDNNLQEVSRIVEEHEPGIIHEAYRLPDGSLVFFGSVERMRFSFAHVMKFDPTLKHKNWLNLATERDTSFWINAAVPTSVLGQFACVRPVTAPPPASADAVSDKQRFGVMLDFISLKQPD